MAGRAASAPTTRPAARAPSVHYRPDSGRVKDIRGPDGGRKSLPERKLLAVGCRSCDATVLWPSSVLRHRACRRCSAAFFGRSALATEDKVPEHYKTFTAALGAIEANYVEHGRVRPPGLRRHPRHAADARSAFELLRPAHLRADARAAGRALLRPRHHHPGRSTATSPSCSVFEGSPAYKKGIRRGDVIAKIDGEDAKGWTTEQADAASCAGPKGTPVQHRRSSAAATTS